MVAPASSRLGAGAEERARAEEMGTQTEKQTGSGGGATAGQIEAHPAPIVAPARAKQPAPERETYAEQVQRLEPLIKAQVENIKRTAMSQGTDPTGLNMVLDLDLTTAIQRECEPCAQHSPSRKPNVKVDLLGDSTVVFTEAMKRIGGSYGIVAHDEKNVYKIRDIGKGGGSGADASGNEKILALLDRRTNPNWKQPGLDDALDNAIPADGPDGAKDAAAIRVATAMLEKEGKGGTIVVAKSGVPSQNLKNLEGNAGKNIKLVGLAYGDKADQVKRGMFSETRTAPDALGIRKAVGQIIADALKGGASK